MNDLLPLSIGLGLVAGLLFGEFFGIASGGLVVPGYLALHLTRPSALALTLLVALLVHLATQAIAELLIVYGRRRTALTILLAYLLTLAIRQAPDFVGLNDDVIGYIIPGLIALWMERQGVRSTLASLAILAVVVRLGLIVLVGAEGLP